MQVQGDTSRGSSFILFSTVQFTIIQYLYIYIYFHRGDGSNLKFNSKDDL
jgi:hypothetical protein